MELTDNKLVIPAGTFVHSMHPRKEHGPTTRKRTILVNRICKNSGEITWAGSGNYWNWCYPTTEMKEANPDFANELESLMLAYKNYCEVCEKYNYPHH